MQAVLNYDFHNHSTCSDGTLAPADVVAVAARRSVHGMALTDHDTTEGLADARAAAEAAGLEFINGVEVSVSWRQVSIHIVGLNVDADSARLQAGLLGIRSGRIERARRMGERLDEVGVPGAFDGAWELAPVKEMIGRTHFARHLVNTGRVKHMQEAFDRYLAKGKPAHVAHQWAGLCEAVDWITSAGGVAVIAHPGRYPIEKSEMRELIEEFIGCGGEGIEVVTGSHSNQQYAEYEQLAREYKLLASRGADYHGPGESRFEPGELPPLPTTVTPVWEAWR